MCFYDSEQGELEGEVWERVYGELQVVTNRLGEDGRQQANWCKLLACSRVTLMTLLEGSKADKVQVLGQLRVATVDEEVPRLVSKVW